jgi:hypothetical protein
MVEPIDVILLRISFKFAIFSYPKSFPKEKTTLNIIKIPFPPLWGGLGGDFMRI